MSAEQGWITEPQPVKEWHRSRASYEADKMARRTEQGNPPPLGGGEVNLARRRRFIEEIHAEQEQKNIALPIPNGPPLRIADQYAAGRPHR